ncbi:MAG: hypothetical protein DRI71_09535, partial [Bacteroidetes bacterium]
MIILSNINKYVYLKKLFRSYKQPDLIYTAMKKLNFIGSAIAIFYLGVLPSCQKEVVIPDFTVAETNITSVGYTMGGTLAFLYSLDDGETFSSELPPIPIRSELMVKVNNGTDDLTADDFIFDWSASSITPDSSTQ